MHNQVKEIVVDDVQNVLNEKKTVEFLEIMKWLVDSTTQKSSF
jgi:hypothetical protein